MSKFADRLGREWTLDMTMGSADQVERDLGIDLLKWLEDPGANNDNRAVFKIVGSLVADQIAARLGGVGALDKLEPDRADAVLREFADGFDGPALERAVDALMEALLFFSQPQRVAKAALPRVRAAMEEATDRVVAAIEGRGSSSSAGASPASAASTPGP